VQEHRDLPLLIPGDAVYTCQNSGACCRHDWLIGVEDEARDRLSAVDWKTVDPTLPPGDKFVRLPLPLAGGEHTTFARKTDGACAFLGPGERCGIHSRLGYEAKPQVCREFPYYFVETPDGVAVGVSFACTAVRAHHGAPLTAQQAQIRDVLAGSRRVGRVPASISLYSGIDIGWNDYRPIETALLDVLARDDRPLGTALIAGSVLVNLAVGLAQVARRDGARPPESPAEALARLASERYARLFDVAAGVRYPKRPSHAHLAPLYAWLRLSRTRLSRVALVAALYADYFRFRKNRGRVPDLITGGLPLDLASVARVRMPDSPATDAFLREYWRHVVWRKTLTPMHGVFRGYHTLLALHAFTRWAAKVRAYRAGRWLADISDVTEAVRLVEQRFVLHSQFGNLFALSPVLTVLADRLFGQPGFVPLAVLEPPA
jgi:Fe-S-cluster containining protein